MDTEYQRGYEWGQKQLSCVKGPRLQEVVSNALNTGNPRGTQFYAGMLDAMREAVGLPKQS